MILVISDIHLTNKFNLKKFNELKELFSKADQIIINGDFWDSYLCSFDSFIKSEWSKLFPTLKSKNTIYLYGNHDREVDCDKRVNLFSVKQGISHKLNLQDKVIHIEHGNRLKPSKYENGFWKWVRNNKLIFYFYIRFMELGEDICMKFFSLEFLYDKDAKDLKEKVLAEKKENEIWVVGHTHLKELDLENGFINTGLYQYQYKNYLVIDEGRMELNGL